MGRASHDTVPACPAFPVGQQTHVALSSQGRHLSPRPGADPQKGKPGLLTDLIGLASFYDKFKWGG